MTEKEIKRKYKENVRKVKADFLEEKKEMKRTYERELAALAPTETNGANNPPKRGLLEEIGNAVTHGVGALFSIVAYLFMLFASDTPVDVVASSIYFAGLFLAMSCSCLYHAFRHGSAVKRLFRRFDYASIYLLIGATFAPVLLCFIGGMYGFIFLIVQWAIILTGITFIGVFGPHRLRKLHMTLYVLLGWSALLLLPYMLANELSFFLFILGGGVAYSLGLIPFALKAKVSHFIWHFFVLMGAVTQWIGIYLYLYL